MLLRVVMVALTAALLAMGDMIEEETVDVNLKQGSLRGTKVQVSNSRPFYSFRGIPYAKPPVGDLRFKDPVPAEGWAGVREPFNPPQCPQPAIETLFTGETRVQGQEDCLYLHVYTPRPCESDLPVMVYIHGGGYFMGDADHFGGAALPLLTKDVVLVSIQYRLGTLGFMSTGDAVMPGNLGLKDQTEALRWVHHNIRDLGGDPHKVTIFGESAGAASAHQQMFVPKAEGLFHRIILQSGSTLARWAIRDDHRNTAIRIGQWLNCTGVTQDNLDSSALLTCVMSTPYDQLVAMATKDTVLGSMPFRMVPRVDGQYLPAHPAHLLLQGRYHHVDIISGVCKNEGASSVALLLSETIPVSQDLHKDFEKIVPFVLFLDEEESGEYLARRVLYHYLGSDATVTQDSAIEVEQVISDSFRSPHELTAQFHSRNSALMGTRVYMYQLDHRGNITVTDVFNLTLKNGENKDWVAHGDDLQYIFNNTFGGAPLGVPQDLFLRDIMVTLWTNFAATGNPTPDMSLGFKWSPATESSLQYLSLTPAPVMRPDTRAQVRAFLTDLPTRVNKLLYPARFSSNHASDDDRLNQCHK